MHARSGYVDVLRYNGLMIDTNPLQEILKKQFVANELDINI